MAQEVLLGKLKITALLHVDTGLHIGGVDDFAAIGAVDKTFIRDPFTKEPIIPGSSLKGKLRSLLRRNDGACSLQDENAVVKRLFGTAANEPQPARLQFFDIKMTRECVDDFSALDTDTYLGEIKFENSINPLTGVANPRQIERVPAGTTFDFQLVYNVSSAADVKEDLATLAAGIELLELDYLGGHGSRGYGRISFSDWHVTGFGGNQENGIEQYVSIAKSALEGSDGV